MVHSRKNCNENKKKKANSKKNNIGLETHLKI